MTATIPSTSASPWRPTLAQWGLLLVTILMWGGFYLIIPLVTVHFVDHLGWAAASVGLALGMRQLAQQGLSVFGGALADRIGPKPLILLGCLVRTAGFGWMAFADTLPLLIGAGVLSGLGGALFDAPKNAAIAAMTPPADRTKMFSAIGTAANLGTVGGPLLGALLIGLGFQMVALLAASAYILSFVLLWLTLPKLVPGVPGKGGGRAGLSQVLSDRPFRHFTLILGGYFVLSVQLNVTMTLKALELGGPSGPGLLYGLSAGLAILLQYPLMRLLSGRCSPRLALSLAVLLVGLALGLLGFVQTFPLFLICVSLYSLGSMVVSPLQQTLTAHLAPPALLASYFGFSALSLGLGGALGNFFGGGLLDWGESLGQPSWPWLVLGAVGLLTAGGLWRVLGVLERRSPNDATPL